MPTALSLKLAVVLSVRSRQANAYREEVIAEATGNASRFDQLLVEYQKAPEVTRQRLYIEAVEDVMTASTKIMIDVEGGNNMLYLPLDKIMEQNGRGLGGASSTQDLRALAEHASSCAMMPRRLMAEGEGDEHVWT